MVVWLYTAFSLANNSTATINYYCLELIMEFIASLYTSLCISMQLSVCMHVVVATSVKCLVRVEFWSSLFLLMWDVIIIWRSHYGKGIPFMVISVLLNIQWITRQSDVILWWSDYYWIRISSQYRLTVQGHHQLDNTGILIIIVLLCTVTNR